MKKKINWMQIQPLQDILDEIVENLFGLKTKN